MNDSRYSISERLLQLLIDYFRKSKDSTYSFDEKDFILKNITQDIKQIKDEQNDKKE